MAPARKSRGFERPNKVSPLEILQAARQLIEKPEHWTRVTYARNAFGRAVELDSEEAVSFCVLGSVYRIAASDTFSSGATATATATATAEAALGRFMLGSIGDFNDTHTHAEVLHAFDRAIEELSRDPT